MFAIGMLMDLDYRILTRKLIKFFADDKIAFIGGKEFRLFETDIAVILPFIPIVFYITTRRFKTIKNKILLSLTYVISLPIFYCFFCFLESVYFYAIITQSRDVDAVLKFHRENVHYQLILSLTIFLTFITGLFAKTLLNKKRIIQ